MMSIGDVSLAMAPTFFGRCGRSCVRRFAETNSGSAFSPAADRKPATAIRADVLVNGGSLIEAGITKVSRFAAGKVPGRALRLQEDGPADLIVTVKTHLDRRPCQSVGRGDGRSGRFDRRCRPGCGRYAISRLHRPAHDRAAGCLRGAGPDRCARTHAIAGGQPGRARSMRSRVRG